MKKDCLMIGEVLKPQGIRGEVKIRPHTADTERFRSWNTLHVESDGGFRPLPFRLSRIHEGYVYAILGDCASADDAEAWRGKKLYVERAQIPENEENETLIADLIGCRAVDEAGHELGILTDVLQYGSVDTWVFKTSAGTLMAPALLSVFTEVDTENSIIHVCREKLDEVAVTDP